MPEGFKKSNTSAQTVLLGKTPQILHSEGVK